MYKIIKEIFTNKLRSRANAGLYIGKLLRYGMLLSCGITVFGGIVYLFQHHGTSVDYSPTPFGEQFGVSDSLRTFSGIFDGIRNFDGASIIQAGVIVLIATPIMRIIFSMITFLTERDFLYVVITLTVLIIILLNMLFL